MLDAPTQRIAACINVPADAGKTKNNITKGRSCDLPFVMDILLFGAEQTVTCIAQARENVAIFV